MSEQSIDTNRDYNTNSGDKSKVDFFTLKQGETAFVRFMHDDRSSFTKIVMHEIPMNGTIRKISCLREGNDPQTACPLCMDHRVFRNQWGNDTCVDKIQQKTYIKLIHYIPQDDGTMLAVPKIWERPVAMAITLMSYIDSYGPLSNFVSRISRNGSGAQTRYDIAPNLNPATFNLDNYPIPEKAFEGYAVLGTLVMNKSYDDIVAYQSTGVWPQANTTALDGVTNSYTESAPTTATQATTPNWNAVDIPRSQPSSFDRETPPWESAPTGPRRY